MGLPTKTQIPYRGSLAAAVIADAIAHSHVPRSCSDPCNGRTWEASWSSKTSPNSVLPWMGGEPIDQDMDDLRKALGIEVCPI